jgi:hypothetical protein
LNLAQADASMNKIAHPKLLLRFLSRLQYAVVRHRQSVLRWTAVCIYTVLALGISLPMPVGKASKEAYPCMNHHCGCQSAEQCWRNCCCMTLEERLVWARQNHVRPPEYALAEARAKGIEWAVNWPGNENKHDTERFCSEQPREHACCGCGHCTQKLVSTEQQHSKGIIIVEALKCYGVGENWQGLAISLPPPVAVLYRFPDNCVDHVWLYSPHFSSVMYPPDVPPPRLLARG